MIEFVPFESEEAKKDAYRNWVRTFLKGKKAELESRKTLREQQTTSAEDTCHEAMS